MAEIIFDIMPGGVDKPTSFEATRIETRIKLRLIELMEMNKRIPTV
jgi:hypothetical protein